MSFKVKWCVGKKIPCIMNKVKSLDDGKLRLTMNDLVSCRCRPKNETWRKTMTIKRMNLMVWCGSGYSISSQQAKNENE